MFNRKGSNLKSPTPVPKNHNLRRPSNNSPATPTVQIIAKIEKDREDRRKAAAKAKKDRQLEDKRNVKMGKPGDVDFQRMIKNYRQQAKKASEHTPPGETKITICVRKRPVNKREIKLKDHDSITCANPNVVVHYCKLRVDGITKYLDNNSFAFDHTFDEESTNEQVYKYTASPLVRFMFKDKGKTTVFAYGQTGSGKTFTMEGIQKQSARDIFREIKTYSSRGLKLEVWVSFFELYGGRCQDLLCGRRRLTIREDGRGEVQIIGLEESEVTDANQLTTLIEEGNRLRTTHATEMNDESSRSHAICQINIRHKTKLYGKMSLIDLAGSERGADSKSHNRQRRMESSEINKSLLALKECFRALDSGVEGAHIPFRASKLTQILKDSFVSWNAKTVMIAAISPSASSADHTINTLRYANRVKEKRVISKAQLQEGLYETAGITPNDVVLEPVKLNDSAAPPKQKKQGNNLADAMLEGLDQIDESVEEEMQVKRQSTTSSTNDDDVKALYNSLRIQSGGQMNEEDAHALEEFNGVVSTLYEEQEDLLNAHMNCIQESAELLTEEGNLLAGIQGDDVVDYDIDDYVARLSEVLERKHDMIKKLRAQLSLFRRRCQEEENASKKASSVRYQPEL